MSSKFLFFKKHFRFKTRSYIHPKNSEYSRKLFSKISYVMFRKILFLLGLYFCFCFFFSTLTKRVKFEIDIIYLYNVYFRAGKYFKTECSFKYFEIIGLRVLVKCFRISFGVFSNKFSGQRCYALKHNFKFNTGVDV